MFTDKKQLFNLGIKREDVRIFENTSDLLKSTPHLVNTKVVRDTKIIVDGVESEYPRSTNLTMPIDMYIKAKRDKNRKVVLKPAKIKFRDSFKRYTGQPLDKKTLMIIRTGGIGDIIFSQPVIKYLKEKYTSAYIVYSCAPRYSLIFKSWPAGLVDQPISAPFSTKLLNSINYHLPYEGAIERNFESHKVNAYDIYSEMAGANINHNDSKYKIELIPDKQILHKVKPHLPKDKFIVIQIMATSSHRMMTIAKWVNILKKLEKEVNHKFIFIDSSSRAPMYDNLISGYNLDKDRYINACYMSEDINHAVAIISLSDGVIGIDSSLSHIGAALDKPVMGIFGPFKGDLRLRYYNNSDWVEPRNCDCPLLPCFLHGNESVKCPYVENKVPADCLEHIDEDEVISKVKRLMGG